MDSTTYPDPTGDEFVKLYDMAMASYIMQDLATTTICINRLMGKSGVGLFTAAIAWGREVVSLLGPDRIDSGISIWKEGIGGNDFTQSDTDLLSAFLSACVDGSYEILRTIWVGIDEVDNLTGLISALIDMSATMRLNIAKSMLNN